MEEKSTLTLGQKLADSVAALVGSWRFVIIQSFLIAVWIGMNLYSPWKWDPYPFILLNLFLSFQAAYTAPFIMMSSNRIEQIDRARSISIYNLESMDHEKLISLAEHIDKHFDNLHMKLDKNSLPPPPNGIP